MDDLLKDFVVETSEHLDIVDAELVRFERDPNNSATLALIFRLVHTIKGTCGFLGLPRLEHLAHAGEDVISGFRDGKPVTAPAVTMILKTIDRIKGIIAELEQNGTEPEGDDEDLVAALRALANEPVATPELAKVVPPAATAESKGNLSFQVLERQLREDEVTLDDLERAFREAPGPDMVLPPAAAAPVETVAAEPEMVEAKPAEPKKAEPKKAEPKKAAKVEAKAEGDHPESQANNENSVSKQSVRVSVGTLDRLMTMVSELVLTRNQLLEIARQRDDADFKSPLQRLSHITAELQDGVMQTRMQPIGSAWTKLSRVVRDLSEELGKKIELIQSGAETEIDRQLLEMIKDPLLHMVRNAADHGLEMPEERVAAGKPAHGTINLRAAQESGYIIVEVTDDGRGIDVERVKAKAIRNGMTTEADIARMSDEQVLRFVMEPGFSTAAAVTNISGRGVGLDVVRSHVEQVGGIVDLRSRAGRGLTVTIKLPLTLAIASALIVEAAGQRFAIPQISVAELVRTQESGEVRIETLNGQATLRLRQKLLPVVDVAEVLNLPRQEATETAEGGKAAADDRLVVVCHVGGNRFGIIVDTILHTEEIVVKPISSKLRHMSVYSGATILGDGSVILILEPAGVARSVVESNSRETAAQAEADLAAELVASAERSLLLLFRAGGANLKAIPLSFIGRLEEFEHAKIEDAGGRAVVQYQGRLMPILGYQPQGGFDLEARQPVLVFHQQDREIGMAVDEIVDVMEVAIQIDTSHATPGTVGATIIDGKTVEIVDVSELVAPEGHDKAPADDHVDVMVVESSEFFRALFAPLLQNAGYRIAVLPSLQAARAALARSKPSVMVIDLDQPGDEGFAFVRELAEEGDAPSCIGLVSRAGPRLIEKGKDAGLYDLVGKFDRQGLMSSIGDVLGGYSTTQWGAAA